MFPKARRTWFAAASALALTSAAGVLPGQALARSEAKAPTLTPRAQTAAPAGAPNVVVVLLDDVGFAASGTFGGPVATPVLDELAREGLRYNRFHTTAMCSPTRASLLTGRNPHAVGMGVLTNSADERPGYNGLMPPSAVGMPEILRRNGYNTAMFGKWHLTPSLETSQSGPFDRWPTGFGFEKFYGFMDGETDQYDPALFEGTTPVLRPKGENYNLTEDLVTRSVGWIRNQHAMTPDKPFFLYLAPGATHAPLQAPSEWIARSRGQFDQGWDAIREGILARQKALGVVPKNTELTPRPEGLPAWDSLTPDEKRVASRLMEVYAGMLAHTDAQVGRLVDALKQSGQFDNTLFVYIVGDNGASADGGFKGSISYMGEVQGMPDKPGETLRRIDELGGATTYPHMPSSWAWALDTPFQWTKKIASHLGGTRNPMIITWPKGIPAHGELRSQFGHVNDILPTVLEAAHIEAPRSVDGVHQKQIDGVSLVYSFNDRVAPERHTTQYFELYGHRAIYKDGWMASAFHTMFPWQAFLPDRPFEKDRWELYDLKTDFSQAHDLASADPARLKVLRSAFDHEAAPNQVLPLRLNWLGTHHTLSGDRTRFTYYSGTHVPENQAPPMSNRSWSLSSSISLGNSSAHGVIAAFGSAHGGWSLFLGDKGHPVFTYRTFSHDFLELEGPSLPTGPHALRVEFAYDGGGYGKGATVRLFVDEKIVREGRIKVTSPGLFQLGESLDVGIDMGSPVGPYPKGSELGYPMEGARLDEVVVELK